MRFSLCLAFVFSIFAHPLWAESPIPERRITLVRDVDFPGGDIQSIFDTTLKACETACLAKKSCAAFTYNTKSNSCFPKAEFSDRAPYIGAFSGVVLNTDPNVLALGEERLKDLKFLPDSYFQNAKDMALDLTNKHVPGDWTTDGLLQSAREARANGNIVSAYRFTGAATVLSDEADHWIEYARLALAIQETNLSKKRTYNNRAVSAAINGYLRAPTAPIQANALIVLSEALEKTGRGRDMVSALRLAQASAPRQDTDAALDRAIAKYGFRMSDHNVDNNVTNPRVCARFSEKLVRNGLDYEPYVQMRATNLAVEAEGNQLCIEGVEHGQRYEVTFREGLPAASGEALAKNVTISLYIKDRAPDVRFPGRAYVLPAAGEIALPIETVNVSKVDLLLRKVSDRSVLRAIQQNYFGRPLSPWEEKGFGNNIATEVWSGSGEVVQELNKDVTTRLPMSEVVGDLTPGIYALQAKIPGADPYENPAATQWFVVSDLGLATMTGADGLHVFLRSLGSADPMENIEVTLLSRANEVLGTVATDAMGYAQFDAGLIRGTGGESPAMVLAKTDTDITFLSLTDPEFDLSDRGVEGRQPAGAIDTFITTDRGAYRAGETINATVLTRDGIADAIEGLPLTAILKRPDGVEFSRHLSQNEVAGGHVFAFRTTASAPRGSWRMDIHADVDAAAIASTRVLIEDFLPERIDFDLALPEGPIQQEGLTNLTIDADYLFGAPAGDLPIEGEMLLRATSSLEKYPGFKFGRYDADVRPEVWYFPNDLRTDTDGMADFNLELPQLEPNFKPLEAVIAVRVSEGSGRPVERKITKPVAPDGPVIGIKPNFEGTLSKKSEASFTLIALDSAQQKTDTDVHWTINRVRTRYQWYQNRGNWNWEPITTRTLVNQGSVSLGNNPMTVTSAVEWGRYEIKVESVGSDFVAASSNFYAGWYGSADASSTPDLLEASLDAENYKPGDTAHFRIVPRYAGKALITVMSNRLIDMKAVEVVEGENVIELPVTDEWGAGAYVTATVIRPMAVDAGRNPARALGLTYAPVDPGSRKLTATFETAAEIDPRGPMPVALRVEGIATGETGYATIAAVDVGILNLTAFKAPDPSAHFFGQRKLGIGMRDVMVV